MEGQTTLTDPLWLTVTGSVPLKTSIVFIPSTMIMLGTHRASLRTDRKRDRRLELPSVKTSMRSSSKARAGSVHVNYHPGGHFHGLLSLVGVDDADWVKGYFHLHAGSGCRHPGRRRNFLQDGGAAEKPFPPPVVSQSAAGVVTRKV